MPYICRLILGLCLLTGVALGESQRPRPRGSLPPLVTATRPDESALAKLKDFSQGSQALYQKIAAGLLRVKIEQHPEVLLPESMRGDWETFRKKSAEEFRNRFASGEEPSSTVRENMRENVRNRMDGRDGKVRPGLRRPEPAGRTNLTIIWMLERFLEQRAKDATGPTAGEAQAVLVKVRALRSGLSGDMYAAVYDAKGHALLLTAVALAKDAKTLAVYAPDGAELSAKVLATDFRRGLTLLQVESLGQLTPTTPGEKPAPGEMLACLSATSGAVHWVTMPLPNLSRRREERFAVSGFTDRAGFVYNVDGQLAAVFVERLAVPVVALRKELETLESGRGLEPRPMGIRYELVPLNAAERAQRKLLGDKPALRVTEVLPGSPAERAGVQLGDYVVSIDGRSVLQMRQVFQDMLTKPTPVIKLGLVRGDETLERELTTER